MDWTARVFAEIKAALIRIPVLTVLEFPIPVDEIRSQADAKAAVNCPMDNISRRRVECVGSLRLYWLP